VPPGQRICAPVVLRSEPQSPRHKWGPHWVQWEWRAETDLVGLRAFPTRARRRALWVRYPLSLIPKHELVPLAVVSGADQIPQQPEWWRKIRELQLLHRCEPKTRSISVN
jgi:hypothetical protein